MEFIVFGLGMLVSCVAALLMWDRHWTARALPVMFSLGAGATWSLAIWDQREISDVAESVCVFGLVGLAFLAGIWAYHRQAVG